ncbi:hypothetical protein XFF6990_290031 [Xanthomonas citri pv. fuscans]|nr:hypothetical protein XFF6990_290031 [Xanthomonas citri pv. fuscans]
MQHRLFSLDAFLAAIESLFALLEDTFHVTATSPLD